MLSFKEFSDLLDDEENKLIELGEFIEEGITLQDEVNGFIAYDRYAEKYAEYIKKIGIKNCFVGVENSSGDLQMLEIYNNKIRYKVESPFSKFSIKIVNENNH
jgi:hypothetical protein